MIHDLEKSIENVVDIQISTKISIHLECQLTCLLAETVCLILLTELATGTGMLGEYFVGLTSTAR